MQRHLEQCYFVKFCVKLKKTAINAFCMFQEAYEEEVMSRVIVFMWHKRFKNGRKENKHAKKH